MKAKKPKPANSSVRMRAAGKRPVLLWLDQDDKDAIAAAAALDQRPVTQFITRAAVAEARRVTEGAKG